MAGFYEAIRRGFPKLGFHLWDPLKKDYNSLGSIVGSPIVGNYNMACLQQSRSSGF